MALVQLGSLLVAALLVWIAVASVRQRARLELRARLFELFGMAARRGAPLGPVLERAARSIGGRRGRALAALAGRLDAGELLAASLERALPRGTLPDEVIATLRSAEGTPALRETLQNLAQTTVQVQRVQDQVSLALAYPSLLAVALIGSYAATDGLLGQLPPAAVAADGAAGVVAGVLVALLWSVMGISVAAQVTAHGGAVHRQVLRLARRLPTVGRLLRIDAAARVLRVASAMSAAGLPLGDILRRAGAATRHPEVRAGVAEAARSADSGAPPPEVWARSGLPDFAVAFAALAVGATPGEVAGRLDRAALACDRRVERGVGRLLAVVQPLAIAVFGLLIALHFAMVIRHVQSAMLLGSGASPW